MGLLVSDSDASEMRRLMDIVSKYNKVEYPDQEEMEIAAVEADTDPATGNRFMKIVFRKK